jgi:uncharacterized protein YjbJ (UPF0337 family)
MKISIPWLVAGVSAGFAVWLLLREQPSPRFAADTGYDSVDDAADRTALWGVKQRAAGKGTNIAGKLKEGIGRVTGNDDLAGEGVLDQVTGKVRDAAGTVADAAGQTLKDLNI